MPNWQTVFIDNFPPCSANNFSIVIPSLSMMTIDKPIESSLPALNKQNLTN